MADTTVRLPDHLGGYEATLVVPLNEGESIVAWVDEYGTITDKTGQRVGDLVSADGTEVAAIVMPMNTWARALTRTPGGAEEQLARLHAAGWRIGDDGEPYEPDMGEP